MRSGLDFQNNHVKSCWDIEFRKYVFMHFKAEKLISAVAVVLLNRSIEACALLKALPSYLIVHMIKNIIKWFGNFMIIQRHHVTSVDWGGQAPTDDRLGGQWSPWPPTSYSTVIITIPESFT